MAANTRMLQSGWVWLGDGDTAWRLFDIINPIRRAATKIDAERYAREPYVLTGDVSALESKEGLGGWSWYTGAAGWSWQLGVEGILGLQLVAGAIQIDPCLPKVASILQLKTPSMWDRASCGSRPMASACAEAQSASPARSARVTWWCGWDRHARDQAALSQRNRTLMAIKL